MSQRPEPLRRLWQWMRPEPDEILLDRYLAVGDESAFNTLVQRYAGLVYSVCRRVLPRAADAEDACQATFLILARRAGGVRKKSSLRCWLHGVAIRVAKANKRRLVRLNRRERLAASAAIVASPAELLAQDDLQDVLRAEVEKLPERYRLPLQLCYWQGQSRDEMAETLGWTPGMVKGQLERAKRRLRARLSQRGVQMQLPIGLGLATLGAATLLPGVISAAYSASTAPFVVVNGLQAVPFLARLVEQSVTVVRASKSLATIAVVAATLGFTPPFLSDPEVEPQIQQTQSNNQYPWTIDDETEQYLK